MKRKIAQIVLSIFLVYHVCAILILPNPDSIIFRQVERIFLNYGNFLGINTTWRFFSPNPLIRMLEYEILDADGHVVGEVHKFPESPSKEGSRESYNRQLNYAMYMMSNMEHLRGFLTPYLCARHPEAHGFVYYSVSRDMPTVEAAASHGAGREYLERITRTTLADFPCQHIEEGNK